MTEDIKVIFIIPKHCQSDNDCSEDMQLAYVSCEQHCGGGLHAQWVHETKYNKFEGLTKRDVFVLADFQGELYEKLRATKCLVVGPRCLSCCLTEGTPIPSGPEPVFTVAMRGLVVSASGLSKHQKEKIRKKVFWMGGIYSAALTDDTTHLVSDTVLSDKYMKSVEKGIPVMCESWIDAVWDMSLRLNINGASPDFDVHRLPPFANLQITTSGISRKDKQMIMKLVNEHGGNFSGAFQSETTDIVILTKEGVGSEKYKAALEYGKACVVPSWVKNSASKGVALPLAQYRVAGASTSSPLAEHRVPDMSLNFSRITNLRAPSNYVDETRANDMSTMSGKMKLSQDAKRSVDTSIDKEIVAAFENMDMSSIKKAGPIFDGFCIWLTGLEGVCRERASACVSRGGGVRYDAAHERVTHAVAGGARAGAAAARVLPGVPVVSALWLVRSVERGEALDEAEFLLDAQPLSPPRARAPDPASPMSKRNLQLLRPPPPPPPPPPRAPARPRPPSPLAPPLQEVEEEAGQDIVNHYLSQNLDPEPVREKTPEPVRPVTNVTNATNAPDAPEVTQDEPTEEIEQIFRGMKIEVQGLDEESIIELGAEVGAAGGRLVGAGAGAGAGGRAGGGGSHVLVPLDFDTRELVNTSAEPVTVFWIKDCLSSGELVPIQYYHRPVCVGGTGGAGGHAALRGVVASLSTYSGVERAFLDELAKLLGATTQLRFCRRNTATALASTHLVCPTPTGDKYTGALKWGLPAVTNEWLLQCAREGRRVSERPYLVGDSKAPPSPEKDPPQEEKPPKGHEALDQLDNLASDKENAMRPPPAPAPAPASAPATAPAPAPAPSREHTPKATKPTADVEEMSPASRYIAMARQGLLGGDSQESPRARSPPPGGTQGHAHHPDGSDMMKTPPLDDALSTPNLRALSPTTRRRVLAVRRGEMPSDPIRTPTDPFGKIETPDSAFGAALRAGGRMSPDARKRLWQVVAQLPGRTAPPASATAATANTGPGHTPLSEIKNRFLAQFTNDAPTPPADRSAAPAAPRKLCLQDQADTPPAKMAKFSADQSAGSACGVEARPADDSTRSVGSAGGAGSSLPAVVDAQLQRLSAALSGRSGPRPPRRATRDSIPKIGPEPEAGGPESQPNTVGWDDTTPHPASTSPTPAASPPAAPSAPPAAPQVKRFMLSSNVDNRDEIISMILRLGGAVCEGSGDVDEGATHLLCCAPGRSEKMLGSVAAGRWVLHPAYIARSHTHGAFLPEEEFEWGNPLARCLPPVTGAEAALAAAAHRWRAARAGGRGGPFAGLVALLHVPPPRRRLLARLVAAGGGEAPDDEPPYSNTSITVCFADVKRYPLSARDASWLRARGVPVCAPVLLSAYLTDRPPPRPSEHCLPEYRPT